MPKKKSSDQTALINEIAAGFLGLLPGWPGPHEKLIVIESDDKTRKPALVASNDVVSMVNEKQLYGYFVRYLKAHGDSRYMPTPRLCSEISKQWLTTAETVAIQDIAMVRFKSEAGLCWNRIAFDPEPGPTPIFDEFCQRVTNVEAFLSYAGSIFVNYAYRQRYLILYGAAGSGKGTFLNFLDHSLGGAATPADRSPRGSDKHFFADIYNARLVYYDDFEDIQAFSCGKFKMATGGLPIKVDPKGQQPFKAKMDAAWIFTMNDVPALKMTDSDQRRAVVCEVKKYYGRKNDQIDKLIQHEAPAIVHKLIKAYCENPAPELDPESFSRVTDYDDTFYRYFWAKHFVLKKGAVVTANQVIDRFQTNHVINKSVIGQYYRWLEENTIAYRGKHHGHRCVHNLEARLVPDLNAEHAGETFEIGKNEPPEQASVMDLNAYKTNK